jgi:phosphopantothenoylcysteine decarboxylase/phosphopantothenate--cysteine ligase
MCQHQHYTSTTDLLDQLTRLSRAHEIAAVFHVAALADFKVKQLTDADGRICDSPKIDSHAGPVTLVLEPALKIIGELRMLFPLAAIVGWKYELAGSREDALARGWKQIREHRTDGCVVNGRAYGRGFAFCALPDPVRDLRDKTELSQFLPTWLTERIKDRPKPVAV